MPFDLTVKLASGVVVTYWIIEAISINTLMQNMSCVVHAYLSLDEKNKGSVPVESRNIDGPFNVNDAIAQQILSQIMVSIKTSVDNTLNKKESTDPVLSPGTDPITPVKA